MISHLLVSAVAAAALVGLWIADPLESTADTVSDATEVEPAKNPAPVAKVQVAKVQVAKVQVAKVQVAKVQVAAAEIPRPTRTASKIRSTATAPAELAPIAPAPELALVEVPDVQKLSVWEARKQLKKQGLRFAFKQGKRRVRHEDFDYYRVRKQSLSAGERVATGTKVTLQVKEIRFASGY